MIEFAWPFAFFLIPLPWLIYQCFPGSKSHEKAALRVADLTDFDHFKTPSTPLFPKFKTFLALIMWLALVVAAARPLQVGDALEIPQSGRDLMLAVDLSGSMQTKDFEINKKYTDRLSALKFIASDFIDRRKGDRIGLILFGSNAYLQTPLTFDTTTVKQLMMEAEIGLAGNETAIGDAIGLAVKQMRESPHASRVLILLTDGNNNSGQLTPERAAEIASHAQLKVHTVAIGSESMTVQTPFGTRTVRPSANIDEKALKMVAEKTGGTYFRAFNTQELAQIYRDIDQLETIERKAQYYRPTEEVYYWPLLAALICAGILLCCPLCGHLGRFWSRFKPWE